MLGLFDSGLGGLSVLRRVRERLPRHDLVYLADQAHVPYGERTIENLHELLERNLEVLNEAGAQAIVVACNTSCAVAASLGWPKSMAPILDLIAIAADALAKSGMRRIGVVATTATAKSGAYGNALRERIPGVHVEEVAAPALVPLVEAGKVDGAEVQAAVSEACAPLSRDLDAVVLACTHYPLLDAQFARALGDRIVRFDPAVAQADAAVRIVNERNISAGSALSLYVTTGKVEPFRRAVAAYTGELDPDVRHSAPVLTRSGNG